MRSKVKTDRLLKLARFLKTVKPELFDLGIEVKGCDVDGLKKQKSNCGSVACAIGWTPVVFPHRYKYRKYQGDNNIYLLIDVIGKSNKNKSNWKDILNFFSIKDDEVDYLFMPGSYPRHRRSAIDVAMRIEHFALTGKMTGTREELI